MKISLFDSVPKIVQEFLSSTCSSDVFMADAVVPIISANELLYQRSIVGAFAFGVYRSKIHFSTLKGLALSLCFANNVHLREHRN